jgi:hypothetical protein
VLSPITVLRDSCKLDIRIPSLIVHVIFERESAFSLSLLVFDVLDLSFLLAVPDCRYTWLRRQPRCLFARRVIDRVE